MEKRLVILDTDIGTDVDDAMALSYLLSSPQDYEILGCTAAYIPGSLQDTNKGEDKLSDRFGKSSFPIWMRRTDLLRKLLETAQRGEVPVVNGSPGTLSGKHIYWNSFEGFDCLCDNYFGGCNQTLEAEEFIANMVNKYPNRVELICIGPLTNIARAFLAHPDTMKLTKRIIIMGGHLQSKEEHNFRCDSSAAHIVFAQKEVPIFLVCAQMTRQVVTKQETLNKLLDTRSVFGDMILQLFNRYCVKHNRDWTMLHDPFTIWAGELVETHPELYEEVYVKIQSDAALTVPTTNPNEGRKVLHFNCPTDVTTIVNQFNQDYFNALFKFFTKLRQSHPLVFISGSGLDADKLELCKKVTKLLKDRNAQLIYCGSDVGNTVARMYDSVLPQQLKYAYIFQYYMEQPASVTTGVRQYSVIWNCDSWTALRRHIINMVDTVVICKGGEGSQEEEQIAVELKKEIITADNLENYNNN